MRFRGFSCQTLNSKFKIQHSKAMKEIVIEQLRQRDLMHLYSDARFKQYLSKTRRNRKGGNNYLVANDVDDSLALLGEFCFDLLLVLSAIFRVLSVFGILLNSGNGSKSGPSSTDEIFESYR